MGIPEYLNLLVTDYTVRTISMGTALMGIVCGMLGSFAMLRRQSLLGDAVSHAALPGIALAFLLTGFKDPWIFFTGAIASGVAGTLWISAMTRNTHLKSDTALGIVLSVFFGFGMLLLSVIQKQPNANQSGLEKFLFGQAATILTGDVWFIAIAGSVVLTILLVFWKEFKIMAFDPQYAGTLGYNTRVLDLLLTVLIVVAIVLGLQTVGVVLMSAMLIAPAAAARQWTNRFSVMILLSSLFGAVSGIAGTAISTSTDNMATGPVIVLIAILIVVVSFVFSPGRGLLFREIRYARNRKSLRLNKTLSLMYEIVSEHNEYTHPHSVKMLNNFRGFSKSCLKKLESDQLVTLRDNNRILTEKGFLQAKEMFGKTQSHEDDTGSD